MQAIILAAGKGTRMGKLTKSNPKPLLPVLGKPILEYTLSNLPSSIDEVFIVIHHLGEKIKSKFGNKFKNLKINYIQLPELTGTAGSLWTARKYLKKRFLVLNGDDIYDQSDLKNILKADWAFGLAKRVPPRLTYLNIILDKKGNIAGHRYPSEKEMKEGILMATGAYVLQPEIFKYKPVRITDNEYGLPQTIFKLASKKHVKGVLMKNWIQINTPEDIKKAEKTLTSTS